MVCRLGDGRGRPDVGRLLHGDGPSKLHQRGAGRAGVLMFLPR